MTASGEDKAKKALEVTAKAGIAATQAGLAAAAVGAALGAPVVIGAALGLAPTAAAGLLGLAFGAHSRKVQTKVDRWFERVAADMEFGSVEAAALEIGQHIDEGWAHEAIIEATKRILEDIDEAAVPFLARLTAHSLKTRRIPDDRDKRAAALLVDCRAALIESLRSFVLACQGSWPGAAISVEAMLLREIEGAEAHPIEATTSGTPGTLLAVLTDYSPPTKVRISASESTFDVFVALKKHGFATDNPSGFHDIQAGPHVARLQKIDIDFLCRLLN